MWKFSLCFFPGTLSFYCFTGEMGGGNSRAHAPEAWVTTRRWSWWWQCESTGCAKAPETSAANEDWPSLMVILMEYKA